MDRSNHELYYIFHSGSSDKVAAEKFCEALESKKIKKGDILNYIGELLRNTCITSIVPILRQFSISLRELEDTYTFIYALFEFQENLSEIEFNAVIDYFKESKYDTFITTFSFNSDGAKKKYFEHFNFSRTEKLEIATECSKKGHLPALCWIAQDIDIKDGEVLESDMFANAKENNHKDICDWVVDKLYVSLEEPSEPQPFTSVIRDLMEEMPVVVQRDFIKVAIQNETWYSNEVIKKLIDGFCTDGNILYDSPQNYIIRRIADVYEFKSKFYEEVVEILKRICKKERVNPVIEYLISEKIIISPEKKPSLEDFQRFYPDYIIAKPEELSNYIAKEFE